VFLFEILVLKSYANDDFSNDFHGIEMLAFVKTIH
jgi:hypothetical protein